MLVAAAEQPHFISLSAASQKGKKKGKKKRDPATAATGSLLF
jgi:hypothetical protein